MYSITSTELMITVLVTGIVLCAVIILIFFVVRWYYKKRLASTTLYFTPSEPESVTWVLREYCHARRIIFWKIFRAYSRSSTIFCCAFSTLASLHEYEPDEWEVPIQEIDVIKPIARGSFGIVYHGCWKKNNKVIQCAFKTAEKNNVVFSRKLLTEANVMKEFNTSHVVRLYGVVSQNEPVFIITEFMQQGDLRSFLRLHHLDKDNSFCFAPPSLTDILRMAIEIADGMSYLSFKKYVHRDLSASHCLVSANNVVKVAGFGLTRDIYQTDYYKEGMMPIRWMAPESLHTGLFTYYSDVWSFGVLLWELATLGSDPYKDDNDKDVISFVTSGGIMEKPENCPDILYDYMKYCWCFKASDRPTFNELVKRLLPCARPDFESLSFYHNGLRLENIRVEDVPDVPKNDILSTNIIKKECRDIDHGSIP